MNLVLFLKCLVKGHNYVPSRTKVGYMTCKRCKHRK